MADIIIIAVLILGIVVGVKRGLLQSLAGVIVVVLAFFGASLIADALAEPVARYLQPLMEQRIQQKLPPEGAANVTEMLETFHFSGASLQTMAQEILDKVAQTGVTLLSAVVESVMHSVAYAIVYLVAFLLLLVVLHLLMKPLKLMTRLPGIHMLNGIGGGALGLVWSALLVFLAVWLLLRFDWLITAETIDKSPVLRFFAENSPISLLTSL